VPSGAEQPELASGHGRTQVFDAGFDVRVTKFAAILAEMSADLGDGFLAMKGRPKDFLIHTTASRDRGKHLLAAKLGTVPIETEISDDGA
jgi:hypothetical protein